MQPIFRDLAKLHLPLEDIEPLLNTSDHGALPAWLYLYHIERVALALGKPIHFDPQASSLQATGYLGGVIKMRKRHLT